MDGEPATAVVERDRRSLRAALHERRSGLLGSFVLVPRIEMIELFARAGFDAVVLDLEHGPYGLAELPPLIAAAHGAGLFAVVRVGESSAPAIAAVLDAGADGILVPHVSTAGDAQRIVAAGRFPPAGERSINPYVRGLGYAGDSPEVLTACDARTALIVMVEGAEGIRNLDAIAAVPGVDAIFLGPVDISASMGLPNQPEHPDVISALAALFARCAATGTVCGVYAPNAAAAARWFDRGATFVAASADVAMILGAFERLAVEIGAAREL